MFGKIGGNRRPLRWFSRDRSGAALVEFALIGSMLLFSILFIVELGLTHFTTLQLESATSSMARVVRTGRINDLRRLSIDVPPDTQDQIAKAEDKLTESDVREYVCGRLIFAIRCTSNSRIFIRNAQNINVITVLGSIEDPHGADEEDSLQAPGADHYVIVTVFLRSPFSVLGNSYDLRAATVMRNEPFPSTSG